MTPPLFEKPLRTAALGLLLLTSFACSQGSGPDPGTALGEAGQDSEVKEALADEDTMHAAMGIVRGVLYGETAPTQSSELGSLPGRRAFVCAYQERPTRICATGTGSDLAGSSRRPARDSCPGCSGCPGAACGSAPGAHDRFAP